jgi:hypothetical protein
MICDMWVCVCMCMLLSSSDNSASYTPKHEGCDEEVNLNNN